MIKLIGCVLIISACTQMGCAMATDKIRQMKYLKLFRRLIFETRAMVEGGMTFGEIILKLSLQSLAALDEQISRLSENFTSQVRLCRALGVLSGAFIAILLI